MEPPASAFTDYFAAERRGSALLLVLSLLGFGATAVLFRFVPTLRWGALPFAAISAIQLVVGLTILIRTPGQLLSILSNFERERARIVATEAARITRVLSSFRTYESVEIALLATGLVGSFSRRTDVRAAALSLTIEAGAMLLFDLAAERRARRYAAFLGSSGGSSARPEVVGGS